MSQPPWCRKAVKWLEDEGADAPDMSGASPVLSGANFELSGTPDSTEHCPVLSGAVRCSEFLFFLYQLLDESITYFRRITADISKISKSVYKGTSV